jgi:ribosomal protein S21
MTFVFKWKTTQELYLTEWKRHKAYNRIKTIDYKPKVNLKNENYRKKQTEVPKTLLFNMAQND